MSVSLHAALVPGWLQILRALRGLIDKANAHCRNQGIAPATLLDASLVPDMLPLAYQLYACAANTRGAIEGVRAGSYTPGWKRLPAEFAAHAGLLDETIAFLASLEPADLDGMMGADMVFILGDKLRHEYTAENFLLGFAQPNFYFHASTAYDLLRVQGLAIGKWDFLGALPLKG